MSFLRTLIIPNCSRAASLLRISIRSFWVVKAASNFGNRGSAFMVDLSHWTAYILSTMRLECLIYKTAESGELVSTVIVIFSSNLSSAAGAFTLSLLIGTFTTLSNSFLVKVPPRQLLSACVKSRFRSKNWQRCHALTHLFFRVTWIHRSSRMPGEKNKSGWKTIKLYLI